MNSERGVALILVLMLSMLLGVIAIGFQTHARNQVDRLEKQVIKAELVFLLESELNKLLFEFSTSGNLNKSENLQRSYRLQNGNVSVEVNVSSYRNRLSLMTVDNSQLLKILNNYFASPSKADIAVASLSDWIDADEARSLNGFESADYARQNKPSAKNGFINSIAELQRVNGFSEIPFTVLENMFTVYPVGELDMLGAAPELLSAYYSDDIVRSLVEARSTGSLSIQEFRQITGDEKRYENFIGEYFLEVTLRLSKKNIVEQKIFDVKVAPLTATPVSILATRL